MRILQAFFVVFACACLAAQDPGGEHMVDIFKPVDMQPMPVPSKTIAEKPTFALPLTQRTSDITDPVQHVQIEEPSAAAEDSEDEKPSGSTSASEPTKKPRSSAATASPNPSSSPTATNDEFIYPTRLRRARQQSGEPALQGCLSIVVSLLLLVMLAAS